MRSKITKAAILFLTLLLGGSIGFGYSWWQYSGAMETAVNYNYKIFSSMMYGYEFAEADKQYLNQNKAVAIYVLERTLQNGAKLKPPLLSDRRINWDAALIHARLGKLYRESGNKQLSEAHLDQAVIDFEKFGWKINASEVLEALPLLDTKHSLEAVKKFGKSAKTGQPTK